MSATDTEDTRPRGVRNNNPGNLDFDPRVPWQGQLGLEIPRPGIVGRFARFDTPANGIRALCKVLIAYQQYHGLYSLAEMCRRWAPMGDGANNPMAYASAVCGTLNAELHPARPYTTTTPISMHEPLILGAVAKGFIKVECAGYEYPPATLYEGVAAAEAGRV